MSQSRRTTQDHSPSSLRLIEKARMIYCWKLNAVFYCCNLRSKKWQEDCFLPRRYPYFFLISSVAQAFSVILLNSLLLKCNCILRNPTIYFGHNLFTSYELLAFLGTCSEWFTRSADLIDFMARISNRGRVCANLLSRPVDSVGGLETRKARRSKYSTSTSDTS